MARFAVTGGRNYSNREAVEKALAEVDLAWTLVHGAATGADQLAAQTWIAKGGRIEAHPAQWSLYGRSAGLRRNVEMVRSGLELLLAFPGGKGTQHMILTCRRFGVPIRIIDEPSPVMPPPVKRTGL